MSGWRNARVLTGAGGEPFVLPQGQLDEVEFHELQRSVAARRMDVERVASGGEIRPQDADLVLAVFAFVLELLDEAEEAVRR